MGYKLFKVHGSRGHELELKSESERKKLRTDAAEHSS
jgi:hypothetical protein